MEVSKNNLWYLIRSVLVDCRSEASLKSPVEEIGSEEVEIFCYERERRNV